ncbi:MAG: SecDF P1 head subdomain-containing protein [Solirubrobacteraceae bacterium]
MSGYFDRVERQLVNRVQASPKPERSHRWSRAIGVLVPIGGVVVVLAVVAVFIGVGHRSSDGSSAGSAGSSIVFQTSAVSPHSSLRRAIDASVVTLRRRLHSVAPDLRVSRSGEQVIVSGVTERTRTRVLELAVPGRFRFYDWEANALAPNGKSVAGQLTARHPNALTISQGTSGDPGLPGGGALPLFRAVMLASTQPVVGPSQANLSRSGASYYLFGATGSSACASVAHARGKLPVPGEHCLLAGPAATPQSLKADLPAGLTAPDAEQLAVPQGTVVVQAANANPSNQITVNDPGSRFYVLRDNVGLTGADITNPRPSTYQGGQPDVAFGFGPAGQTAFRHVTATIAHRGATVSPYSQALNQHFAVVLDTRLITVPSIDFKIYPDGITGDGGADITGAFTPQSARDLAAILRSGPLALSLTPR